MSAKLSKFVATAAAAAVALTLSACSSDDEGSNDAATTTEDSAAVATSDAPAPLPTAEELNGILAKATDPSVAVEEKVKTVQGGETAPELFEVMTASKAESGADFQVVQPILPGYSNDSVLATVNFTLPEQAPEPANNVEFVFEDGVWKLSRSWACTLITNTVTPEQVPAMCSEDTAAPAPAAPEAPAAPAPEGAPVAPPAS